MGASSVEKVKDWMWVAPAANGTGDIRLVSGDQVSKGSVSVSGKVPAALPTFRSSTSTVAVLLAVAYTVAGSRVR